MRTKGTKFLTFYQNNSGGYYLIDDNVNIILLLKDMTCGKLVWIGRHTTSTKS